MSPVIVNHMARPYGLDLCSVQDLIASLANPISLVVIIPVYEFIVYPFFRKYVLPMLKRIGWGTVVCIIAMSLFFVLDVVGHQQYHSAGCMFYQNEENLELGSAYTVIPIVAMSFGEFLVFITGKSLHKL